MRAVLLSTGYYPNMEPLLSYRPTPLLNVADKPIIFYIIESLTQQGMKQLDLVVSHLPEQIEEKLEDGKRWGIQIQYHLAKDPKYPFSVLAPTAKGWNDSIILLGQGDTIPHLPTFNRQRLTPPLFLNNSKGSWSGWGLFAPGTLANLPLDTPIEKIPSLIQPHTNMTVKPFLNVRGIRELKETNLGYLAEEPQKVHFPTTARKVEPGIWISRAVSIEPEVNILPPVFIGENTQIKFGAQIGPHTIIENNCIIDSRSTIENSIVCQRSYVGETLEVKDCVVDRNCLINLTLGTQLHIKEEFILSDSTPPALHRYLRKLLERFCALLLVGLLSPFFLAMRLAFALKREEKLLLPASENPAEWQAFEMLTFDGKSSNTFTKLFQHLPMLINVIKGEISFVGVPPRSISETEALPSEWRKLYLKSKTGIITLCDVDHGPAPTVDDKYAAEAFYATQKGVKFDIKLLLKWLFKRK
ncbi:MAG: sugar transferase [Waddliaceae bacterium]